VQVYEQIRADPEFTAALGRVTLAAARLESDIRVFLALHDVQVGSKTMFGGLVAQLKDHGLVSGNGAGMLRMLARQRNYFTHSLYDLCTARIDQGLMLREELADLRLLAERAWFLEENLNGLSQIAEERIAELKTRGGQINGLLFGP